MSKCEEGQEILFEAGMPIRRAVLSDAYVDRALGNRSSEFAKSMQEFTAAEKVLINMKAEGATLLPWT